MRIKDLKFRNGRKSIFRQFDFTKYHVYDRAIEGIVVLVNKGKRLGDFIAKTKVVRHIKTI